MAPHNFSRASKNELEITICHIFMLVIILGQFQVIYCKINNFNEKMPRLWQDSSKRHLQRLNISAHKFHHNSHIRRHRAEVIEDNQKISVILARNHEERGSKAPEDITPVMSSCRKYAKQVEKKNIEGLEIENVVDDLASDIRRIVNLELGVTKMQSIYDYLPFVTTEFSYKEQSEMMARRIKDKIGNYIDALNKNVRYIEGLYTMHLWQKPITDIISCYNVARSSLKFKKNFGTNIDISNSCEIVSMNTSSNNYGFSPGRNLTKQFWNNLNTHPFMKWQYFISSKGLHSEYPSYSLNDYHNKILKNNHFRHGDVYLSTVNPVPKFIVILIDHSGSVSENQFKHAKDISIAIINSLSNYDYVSIVTIANTTEHPCLKYCPSKAMMPVDNNLKNSLRSCIENLRQDFVNFGANHSLGFYKAFNILSESLKLYEPQINKNVQPVIVYVSRGLLLNINDVKPVLSTINVENRKLNNSVIINTCAVVNKYIPSSIGMQFLEMIAQQINSVNISNPQSSVNSDFIGKVVVLNSFTNLRSAANALLLPLKPKVNENLHFSLGKWDSIGKGVTISIAKPCFNMRNVIGVTGIDFHLEDLTEDIQHFSSSPSLSSYAFIVHKSGFIVAHSLFGHSRKWSANSSLIIDVSDLQIKVENFPSIRDNLLHDYVGQKRLKMKLINSTANSQQNSFTHVVYTWRKVDGTPFTVCIVAYQKNHIRQTLRKLDNKKFSCNNHVRYHRLDINPPNSGLCRHLNQLSSVKTSTLFLSPSSFISPYKYLNQKDTKEKIDSYLGYLCDTTNLIPNPGMKSNLKNDVSAVVQITDYWKQHMKISGLNDYIFRRYVGLSKGILHTFPGMVVNKDYEVVEQKWYSHAVDYTGKVVVSTPFSDEESGVGDLVTFSHTIYEGKHASLHSRSDEVIAVMAMDVTLGYVNRLLGYKTPLCYYKNMRCFIFNDEGYIIAHPDLVKPGVQISSKFNHITHREQLIANDILCHEGFVEKQACIDHQTMKIQRSYRFNSNFKGVLTNLVHGEHCARYQITVIPGTNLFLGVINQTCEVRSAFCSCSTLDSLCLICSRMEQTECECPCECSLKPETCESIEENDLDSSIEMCSRTDSDEMMASVNYTFLLQLNSCNTVDCRSRKSYKDCYGVIGCMWCEQYTDGSYIGHPFCAEHSQCFHGFPLSQGDFRGNSYNNSAESSDSTTLTGIILAIIASIGLFILMTYVTRKCRHNDTIENQIETSVLPSNDNLSKINVFENENDNERDDFIDDFNQTVNPQGILLAEFQTISPYRINSSYRRPAGCESVDHGYSTMTPRDDSVHNDMSSSEPLVIIENRNSDTTQSLTSFNSATSFESGKPVKVISPIKQTVLPGNKIIAHAQVHMVECL